jgi:hypothetical protein
MLVSCSGRVFLWVLLFYLFFLWFLNFLVLNYCGVVAELYGMYLMIFGGVE